MTSSQWKINKDQIMTRWAKEVKPNKVLSEYPRPHLVRNEWLNLNGLWDYSIQKRGIKRVLEYEGKILVPFPIESALSGVQRKVKPKHKLWYRRFFDLPDHWKNRRVLIHFGAVDWESTIYINKNKVAGHRGGYTPFSFDITDFLIEGENELVVSVWDPTDKGLGIGPFSVQEHGKQCLRPYGVFYTAVTGIWQTVWLEPVPEVYIESLKVVSDIDKNRVSITALTKGDKFNISTLLSVEFKKEIIGSIEGPSNSELAINLPEPHLWSPENPFLYDLEVQLEKNNEIVDRIHSYFGMRKIAVQKDANGIPRIMLNNKVIFQLGLLDQGYWPDGLYTAPTDEALRYDIEIAKELGYNVIRKHIKVEPARWYYHCDKLGMLVWQDMPTGGTFNLLTAKLFSWGRRGREIREEYFRELKSMIECLYNFPCIITWVAHNEGWGQFETAKATKIIRSLDQTRLIDEASGWFDKGGGDFKDIHVYPGPKIPKVEERRAAVLGEFGGTGLKVEGHIWKGKKIYWAYRKVKSYEELNKRYMDQVSKLKDLKEQGLTTAIYTQTTDVEGEINGIMTYDREIVKLNIDSARKIHRSLVNNSD
ncbi:MAG: glycoside hydrolase family 2 protein [Candidatus Hodarchaeales archaeon]